ncbi:MAG: dltA [Candidatus Eremiobacteraeota bacterium]|nr:dltA [Candidatus Eremiobacteraeota bacterium]
MDPGVSPLSAWQTEIWLAMQLADTGSAFNLPMRVRVHGEVSVERLHEAFAAVCEDNEQLRTVIDADAPLQHVLTGMPAAGDSTPGDPREAERIFAAMAGEPFALGGPLLRFAYARHDEPAVELLLVVHHLVFDGTSQKLLVDSLAERCAGQPVRSGCLPYADYAARNRAGLAPATAVRPWSAALAALRASAVQGAARFGPLDWVQFRLSGPVLERFKSERRRLGCSVAELWLASFAAAVRAGGSAVPIVRLGVDARPDGFAATMGNFTNVLPLVAPSSRSLEARIAEAKTSFGWAKAAKADASGELLAREDRAALSSAPIMTHRRFARAVRAGGCTVTADAFVPTRTAKAPFVLQSIDYGDEVALRLEFDARAIGAGQRRAVASAFADDLALLGIAPDVTACADGMPDERDAGERPMSNTRR